MLIILNNVLQKEQYTVIFYSYFRYEFIFRSFFKVPHYKLQYDIQRRHTADMIIVTS